ncbi:MAG: transcriptional repressor NrdR, partial [Clostridiaceae bacterium]|nr:transcriptional repressor NrdR [Clostridiaceae bacterium]
MKCPNCEGNDDRVVDSRPSEDGSSIRRRRECLVCGSRFTTYERVESVPLMVIKKDGSRQPFDRQKLLIGIMKSCEK